MRRTVGAWAAVLLVALGCALGLQLQFSAASGAHSVLLSSNPVDGQVLASAPSSIELQFSEAIDAGQTRIDIVDSAGRHFAAHSIRLVGEAKLQVTVGQLPDETYRISWQTVASDDRHATSGVVVFGIGNRAQVSSPLPSDPFPSSAEVALRWLLITAMGGLVGGLVLVRLIDRRSNSTSPVRLRSRLLRVSTLGGAMAVPCAATLMVQQSGGFAAAYGLIPTAFGERSLVRITCLLVLLGIAIRRSRRPGQSSAVADGDTAVALLVLLVSSALLGHAATSPARVGLESLHLLAALIWYGSLLAIAAVLLELRPSQTGSRSGFTRLLRDFGAIAGGSVAVLAVTGLLLTGDSAASIDSIVMSTFGRILLVKLFLALAGGLLGWRSHRRLRSTVGSVTGRALRAELVLLALVVGGGAALASAAPPHGAQWRAQRTVVGSTTVSAAASGLVESVQVSPNLPGRNFLTVHVFNTRRPAPGPITSVAVQLATGGASPTTLTAHRAGSGDWLVATDLFDATGTWQLQVQVNRPDLAPVALDYPWTVGGQVGGPSRPVISQASIAPLAGAAAGGLAAAVLSILLGGLIRRRRRQVLGGRLNSPQVTSDLDAMARDLVLTRTSGPN